MSGITTVIFDMFNTLVKDGESYWIESFQRVIDQQGLGISAIELRLEWSTGDQSFREQRVTDRVPFESYRQAWQRSFRRTFASLGLNGDSERAVESLIGDMGRRPLHDDTMEALESLKGKYRVAVLSNVDDCVLDVCLERLDYPFEAALSSEAARSYKPRPELFGQLVGRLGIRPGEAVYVGDKQYEDVQGARESGIGSFWINRDEVAPNPGLPDPDYCAKSLLELPAWLSERTRQSR